MTILLMIGFGAAMGVTLTPLAALGVIQAPEDEPGSLPGISNAAFGIAAFVTSLILKPRSAPMVPAASGLRH